MDKLTLRQLETVQLVSLKGIGMRRLELFFQQGVHNAAELLSYFPRNYVDERLRTPISEILVDQEVIIRGRLVSELRNVHTGRMTITNGRIADETGQMPVVWFNQPYMVKNLVMDKVYLFQGKVRRSGNRIQLSSPKVQPAGEDMPGIVPVYPLGGGLTQKMVCQAVEGALDLLDSEDDYLPMTYRQDMPDQYHAYRQMHRPDSFEQMEKARERLVFDELFVQQLALRRMKSGRDQNLSGIRLAAFPEEEKRIEESLPYRMTGAQIRSLREIREDLAGERPMNRMMQGDVGSGKTIVAMLSCYRAFLNGYQSALMVPTEVLARQHFQEAKKLLEPFGVRVALLTGSVTGKIRQQLLSDLRLGHIDLVIGTHALIQDTVVFHKLGLVITDEQHRFGVRQRLLLSRKNQAGESEEGCNVLVMTATPIPRTLTMILYGDMDISVLDEMPPGRTPVKTYSIDSSYEERLYQFIRKQVEDKHQVYIICPAVDTADKKAAEEEAETSLRSAVSYAEFLSQMIFPDLHVGLLHGQMRPQEKDTVMQAFVEGNIDILVSTTVVEVGVNVPNASLMIVENAERFGLAQLHQLRGRVGRGHTESYCVLVSDQKQPETRKRLKVLVDSTDGFYIAEEDLKMRGSGDVFGLRQHGLPDFKLADLFRDMPVLSKAQSLAETVMRIDPELLFLEHKGIREMLDIFLERAVLSSGLSG